jgi:hypothetical protein
MRIKLSVWILLIGFTLFYSCNNSFKSVDNNSNRSEDNILQQEDGTISLNVDNAVCYHDMTSPSSNTAEWNVVILKSGRFNVWLSSATKDTINMQYGNSVVLSILDKRLETQPLCDKVFLTSNDVTYPYFRTDSFMGSLFIQDTGLFNIQVISDKILPHGYIDNEALLAGNTKLLSVFLTPSTK